MAYVRKYEEFVNELLRAGKPYHGSKIIVFDLDDTLVITDAKIKVCNKKTGECFSLTPEEFNEYEKHPDHELDFDDFKSLEVMKAGRLIDYYLKIFKDAYRMKIAVGIVTARDDREMIYRWLREHVGYRIDKDLIFAVNDPVHKYKGSISDRKKAAFKDLIDMGYSDFQFYDDDEANLTLVKSLEKEYPQVNISTIRAQKAFSI
jgi:FMN phosphatase YigB (HAD superfamily)